MGYRVRELSHRGVSRVLLGRRSAGNDQGRCVRSYTGRQQASREVLEVSPRHVESNGFARVKCRQAGFPAAVMRRRKHEPGGGGTVRQGRLQGGRNGESSGDPGNDFKPDPGLGKRINLFSRPAKDQRVPGLESKDGATRSVESGDVWPRVFDHQGVDAALGDAWLTAALSYGDDLCKRVCQREDMRRNEIIRQDDLGSGKQVCGAQGEQGGITGPGAAEVHHPGCGWGAVRGGVEGIIHAKRRG